MEPYDRADRYAGTLPADALQQVKNDLTLSAAMAAPGSEAGALSELYQDAATEADLLGPFGGRSVTDLDGERARIEHTLDNVPFGGPVVQDLRERLDKIRAEICALGDTGL